MTIVTRGMRKEQTMIDYEDLILQRQEEQEILEDDPDYFNELTDDDLFYLDDYVNGVVLA